ncbi:efflux RND transporter periplasmic adaptor subunit [Novilysobacter erysipheiresistens]|uniref:Efflux RND transporter periplasmic adaptor subunit n=1 Tax=Novilysobacter erysipheiresistens TaxID=1749332 RepID=A0ABU7YZJ5_9GAMM
MRSRVRNARSAPPRLMPALMIVVSLLAACAGDEAAVESARPVLVTRPQAAADGFTSLAGEIRAREESPLSFRVGGKLVERQVDVGDHVKQGQVLATLDAGDLQARARAARAQLAAAEAELGRARADRARFATLAEQQLVSRSTMDAQNAAAIAAEGQVKAARAELEVAGNQAAYSQLLAPADGVIAARQAEAGQVVGVGQPVFTLAVDGRREVEFAVPEGAIDTIKPGQAVVVELWSEPGKRWPGTVREIAPVADAASRTFAARATIDAPAGTLDLGQSARVYFTGSDDAALSVPLSALQRVGEDAVAVFVVDPASSTLKLQPIRIGPYGSERAPVLDGLAPDAWVVAAGGHLLREGLEVVPVDRDNRPVTAEPDKPATPAAAPATTADEG